MFKLLSEKLLLPNGYKFMGRNVGIKKRKNDLGILYSEKVCQAAAVFTKNTICGVSIPIGRENVSDGNLQAIVVTSGIANVATGEQGKENALSIIEKVAEELHIDKNNVLPSSTGVIGKQLPIDLVLKGLANIEMQLTDNYEDFATAIMTTDKKIKVKSIRIGNCTLTGVAKGSGMIEPNMATMLVYFFTDAQINSSELKRILKKAVDLSFNMISIDTDTSTSDTVVLMANGQSGEVDLLEFEKVCTQMCIEMAKEVVIDGEGATKLIEVNVYEAKSFIQAKTVAKSIINSPLVKTAVYGSDPNWGRIIMAIGKVGDEEIKEQTVSIYFGDQCMYDKGAIFNEAVMDLKKYLQNTDKVSITVNLHLANESATVWGCDLTEEYVHINGMYTT